MPYFARSAAPKQNAPSQTYLDHVLHVLVRGRCYLRKVLRYAPGWDAAAMLQILELAAEYHDLGKLNDANQEVLRGEKKAKRLPVPHPDAGVAYLTTPEQEAFTSALLVYAHHAGLPDYVELNIHGMRNLSVAEQVNQDLPTLLVRHENSVRQAIIPKFAPEASPTLEAADVRVLFSCLTHADHGDAARASNQAPQTGKPPKLHAADRLEALRRYVGTLSVDGDESERNQMRTAFFETCFNGTSSGPIAICDAPVGTGKTTSVMSNLLRVAERQGLRRIFVILPFTNIITQSVKTFRKALVLDEENPEDVVAEIHHRADFESPASRKLTALWEAPIVVTTAVAFFETLASAAPSALRRLQNLPGSAIFLDEAHAMLPVKLLPLAWQWIQHAATKWSCHWVLASGSLCHFWSLEEFRQGGSCTHLPNLLPAKERERLQDYEVTRVEHLYHPESMYLDAFAQWLQQLKGPIIVVVNTVHTAAAAARAAVNVFGKDNVMHLSTSLTPADREVTLNLVKARLKEAASTSWCLIATSCVEAGVDLSFRTGVRECSSLLSLLQLAGRVNRNSEHQDAEVWTLTLNANDKGVTRNPSLNVSSRILREFLETNRKICPDLCTEAMQKEIREQGSVSTELCKSENTFSFKTIEKGFKVIDDDTQLTVVNPDLVQRIRDFEDVSWKDIQKGSVRVRNNIREKLGLEESHRYPGVLLWPEGARYSALLGYMEAVLELDDFDKNGGAII